MAQRDAKPASEIGRAHVSLDHGPGGSTATVSLTNERGKINYVPERDLDRVRQLNTLLPGQGELRSEMNFAKKIAAAVKSSKDAYRLLSDAFHGNFTQSEKAKLTTVMPPQ